jgi:hypothetical protein
MPAELYAADFFDPMDAAGLPVQKYAKVSRPRFFLNFFTDFKNILKI